ncbi:PIN domain-containing protein [Legionella dresdenensis]|uniref:PIN domain-containing protein n=1 Tax=Legionella dresdenensis TaxID=450200 RepID=A0ABV8CE24_9GAMM
MNLFIDTNIFLSFFHLSKDDLEEIHKLIVLLEQNEIKLWITKQVMDEFYRNRENKISDAIKKLKEQRLNGQFPQFCKEYEDYRLIKCYEKKYNQHFDILMSKIHADITNNTFKADENINELFSKSRIIEINYNVVDRAIFRVNIGNPPGKNDLLGDAINWECLLQNIPDSECLYIVTDDKDYYSLLDDNKLKQFLKQEWEERKQSNVFSYRRLSQFFKEHFPDIKLATELEKELAIKVLEKSAAIHEIYQAVESLSEYTEFNQSQIDKMLQASLNNPQIYHLLGNAIIKRFYKSITNSNYNIIDKDLAQRVLYALNNCELIDYYSNNPSEHDYFKTYTENAKKISKINHISKKEAYNLLAKHAKSKDWLLLQEKIKVSLQRLFYLYRENCDKFITDGFVLLRNECRTLLKHDIGKEKIKKDLLKCAYVNNRFQLSSLYLRGLNFDYRKHKGSLNIIENWNWCAGIEMNFSYSVFVYLHFTWSVFINSDFEFTQFSLRSEATKRVLYSNHFQEVVFIDCNLENADLSESYARDAIFFNCKFNNADLSKLKGFMSMFAYCTMKGVHFNDAQLISSNFDGADLTDAQFINANLRGASLRYANLKGANFYNTDLRGADLTGCKNASLEGALLGQFETTD